MSDCIKFLEAHGVSCIPVESGSIIPRDFLRVENYESIPKITNIVFTMTSVDEINLDDICAYIYATNIKSSGPCRGGAERLHEFICDNSGRYRELEQLIKICQKYQTEYQSRLYIDQIHKIFYEESNKPSISVEDMGSIKSGISFAISLAIKQDKEEETEKLKSANNIIKQYESKYKNTKTKTEKSQLINQICGELRNIGVDGREYGAFTKAMIQARLDS